MTPIISFDMDGTLVESEYTDWVWNHGIPNLYAAKTGLPFEEAKAFVEGRIPEGWRRLQSNGMTSNIGSISFNSQTGWRALMDQYVDKINVYPDVHHLLDRLKEQIQISSHLQCRQRVYRCRDEGHGP